MTNTGTPALTPSLAINLLTTLAITNIVPARQFSTATLPAFDELIRLGLAGEFDNAHIPDAGRVFHATYAGRAALAAANAAARAAIGDILFRASTS